MSNIKNVNINVSSTPFKIEQGVIEHAKTEYLISRYPTGISSEYKIIVDSPITSYKITDLEIDADIDWYIFTRYDGNDGKTKSPWSYPVKYRADEELPLIYPPKIISPVNGELIETKWTQVVCAPFRASKLCNHSSTKCSFYDGYYTEKLINTIWLPPVTTFFITSFYRPFLTTDKVRLEIKFYGNNDTVESESRFVEYNFSSTLE